MPASTDTTINIMLFEGGALIASLGANTQEQRLADRIEAADRLAFNAGKMNFDLTLDPIEIGIAFEAVDGYESLLAQAISKKLKDALVAKLQELGIDYGGSGGDPQPGLGDDTEPPSDEPANDGQDESTETL